MDLNPLTATDPVHAPAVPSKQFDRWWLYRIETPPGTDQATGHFRLGRKSPQGEWEFATEHRQVTIELDDDQDLADLVNAVLQAFETGGKAQGIL